MSPRARTWPYLVIALVVYLVAPGTPPGFTVATRADGQTTVERTHAAVRGPVSSGTRASVDGLVAPALPGERLAPAAPESTPFVGPIVPGVSLAPRPNTTAAARAPPAPLHVA